jgi:hypothetical protein
MGEALRARRRVADIDLDSIDAARIALSAYRDAAT